MDSTRVREQSQGGIALFMVIAAMTVLSILVTEFTYVAQVNSKMAFDSLDQIKAHYLARAGLKLSLLRLKAYQQAKAVVASQGGGAATAIPKQILDKIWSFPIFFPIPTELPGLSLADKDRIEKFQKNSDLSGKYTAMIQSESSRYNLNTILAPFANPSPTASASPTPGATATPAPTPTVGASPTPFDPEIARKSLQDYLAQLLENQVKVDPDFGAEYRDLRVDDLTAAIVGWADLTYDFRGTGRELIPRKRAPFYSLAELHMIHLIDDKLFELLEPAFTVTNTPGVNINTMEEKVLRALVPKITDDEVKEFFKFRDDPTLDNSFKAPEDFFTWVQNGVAGVGKSIDDYKESLNKRGIRLVTDESTFKIVVQAYVNQASRLLEAWVTLDPPKATSAAKPGPKAGQPGTPPPPPGQAGALVPSATGYNTDSGLRITFMRIL